MHPVDGLLLSSMCHLVTPRCDLDQPGWICRMIPFVEAQWLSGRMPDSRSRGHRHESSTHISAVDDDRLWRCYATTKYNHCTIVLVLWNKLWFILFIYNTVAPLKLLNDFHRRLIYLCQDIWLPTWYCWYDHRRVYRWKIWDHLLKRIKISNAISLNSDEQQSHTYHLHVLPPKVKVWISAFVLFQKLTYVHEMFPLLRVWQAHHSQLLY